MQTNAEYTGPDGVAVHHTTVLPSWQHRLSWGAIIAGAVIAFITMFILHMLGLSIGAVAFDPIQDDVDGLGTAAAIWIAVSTLIGLFAGGFIAGRMTDVPHEEDGIIHGLITWAVVMTLTLILLTTSIGNLISGVSGALGAAGQAVADVAPEVAEAVELQDEVLLVIRNEVRELTGTDVATDDDELQARTDSGLTLEQLQLLREIRAFLANHPDDITEEDRDELAQFVAERTDLSSGEARERVDVWEATYVDIRQSAEDAARDAAEAVTDTIAMLAGFLFAALLLGAFAAGAGGYVGTERYKDAVVHNEPSAPAV